MKKDTELRSWVREREDREERALPSLGILSQAVSLIDPISNTMDAVPLPKLEKKISMRIKLPYISRRQRIHTDRSCQKAMDDYVSISPNRRCEVGVDVTR